jgi:hypothetical protein
MLQDERVLMYRRRADALRHCAEVTTEIAAQDAMIQLAEECETRARKFEMQTDDQACAQLTPAANSGDT